MSLPERLDDLARLTGIPQLNDRLATGTQRRRHLRWTPMIALAIATAGIIAVALDSQVGMFLLGVGELMAGFLSVFGPIKPWGTLAGVDERDRQLRRDSYFVALAVMGAVAVLGLFALTGLAFFAAWDRARLLFFIPAFSAYLVCLWVTIPTLYASWTTRPIEDE